MGLVIAIALGIGQKLIDPAPLRVGAGIEELKSEKGPVFRLVDEEDFAGLVSAPGNRNYRRKFCGKGHENVLTN